MSNAYFENAGSRRRSLARNTVSKYASSSLAKSNSNSSDLSRTAGGVAASASFALPAASPQNSRPSNGGGVARPSPHESPIQAAIEEALNSSPEVIRALAAVEQSTSLLQNFRSSALQPAFAAFDRNSDGARSSSAPDNGSSADEQQASSSRPSDSSSSDESRRLVLILSQQLENAQRALEEARAQAREQVIHRLPLAQRAQPQFPSKRRDQEQRRLRQGLFLALLLMLI